MSIDIFAQAAAQGERGDVRFGQVGEIEGRFVALIKGQGKVDFDPAIHERRSTEISIRIDPLPESGLSNFDKRDILADSWVWTKIVWPSIKALIKDANNWRNELLNAYVKYELVKEREYQRKDGSTGTLTTFKFLALYDSQEACVAAYEGDAGIVHTSTDDDDSGVMDIPFGQDKPAAVDNAEKQTARLFLDALRTQHTDPAALAQAISGMPMIAKFFAVENGRVVEVVTA